MVVSQYYSGGPKLLPERIMERNNEKRKEKSNMRETNASLDPCR
jgi:hypothetical protein